MIDPNNPTGAVYPEATRRALIELADRAGRADPRRRGLRRSRVRRPRRRSSAASRRTRRSSRFRRCRRPTSRPAGAPAGSASAAPIGWTTRSAAIKKLADGRLCSPGPMQYAIAAALNGRSLAPARVCRGCGARGADGGPPECDSRHELRRAARRVLCDAAGRAAARQDRRRLRARPAARDGHPVRVRIRLRPAGGSGLLSRRLSRVAGRTRRYLRRHGRVHRGVSIGPGWPRPSRTGRALLVDFERTAHNDKPPPPPHPLDDRDKVAPAASCRSAAST